MKTMDRFNTLWFSIPVPDRWTIGREREWIFIRPCREPSVSIKIMPVRKEVPPATDVDVEDYAKSSEPFILERQSVVCGKFTGVVLRVNRNGTVEDRLILKTGEYMLLGHLVGPDLDTLRKNAMEIIDGIRINNAEQFGGSSDNCSNSIP